MIEGLAIAIFTITVLLLVAGAIWLLAILVVEASRGSREAQFGLMVLGLVAIVIGFFWSAHVLWGW